MPWPAADGPVGALMPAARGQCRDETTWEQNSCTAARKGRCGKSADRRETGQIEQAGGRADGRRKKPDLSECQGDTRAAVFKAE